MVKLNPEGEVSWKSWHFKMKGGRIKRAWSNQTLWEKYLGNLDILK